jgi:hypothetical protein
MLILISPGLRMADHLAPAPTRCTLISSVEARPSDG